MDQEHAPDVVYDNLGRGWRITCSCGFESQPAGFLNVAALEYDVHMLKQVPGYGKELFVKVGRRT